MKNGHGVRVRNLLLICGILASLLSVGTDLLAGTLYTGYNFLSQSIGVLSAIGTPTRSLVVSLNLISNVLVIAFALGVWVSAGRNHILRATAGMMAANVVAFMLVPGFFPMQLGEGGSAFTNATGVILGAVSVIFLLLAIGFGAVAYRNWFRYYSIGILVAFFVLTIFGLLATPQVPAGQPESSVGAQERTMSYSYLLWQAVLALVLLRAKKDSNSTGTPHA